MTLVAISGWISSGKDTIADYLINEYGFERDSYARSLKDVAASVFNWPRDLLEGSTKESREWREQPDHWWSEKLGIKDFTPRKALQLFGTEVFRDGFHKDIWILSLQARLNKSNTSTVITDARFKNELDLVKNEGGILVWVKRGDLPEWYDKALWANDGNEDALQYMTSLGIHRSEWEWVGCKFDYIIDNNSSLENLYGCVDKIFHKITE